VAARRTIRPEDVRDLARLDPPAIAQVRSEAWPLVRNAEELHDTLLTVGALGASEGNGWERFFAELVTEGRVTRVEREEVPTLWIAAENWPVIQAALPGAVAAPSVQLPLALCREVSAYDARLQLVRGRMQISGPTTASHIAVQLGMETELVLTALEQLEIEGAILRGQFTSEAAGEVEWCDRRLLARIHRLTLDGLRRQVEPVDAYGYLRFLFEHHGMGVERRHTGPGNLPGTIAQLAGFEAPAGAWEHDLLPTRLGTYEPDWLDSRFAAGELVWGRFVPPRPSEDRHGQPLTRAIPISLARRADVSWLLPSDRAVSPESARWDAQGVYEALSQHGALFYSDLLSATSLLPSQLDDALGELAALGLVTSDSFSAIRGLMSKHPLGIRVASRRRRKQHRQKAFTGGGRWSKFPPFSRPPAEGERAEKWAWLLLNRYGVMFRDLLARETAAPPWGALASVYRRLEMRGEIRGGRFVSGVAGEQFALPDAVERLRKLRDTPEIENWQIISAADPLNLVGIITPGGRVSAKRNNRVVFRDGRPIAAREAGEIRWLAEVSEEDRQRANRLLAGPDALRRAEVAVQETVTAEALGGAEADAANSLQSSNGGVPGFDEARILLRRAR
jgi:ATP-dependent Lhr-like helicase